MGLAPRIILSLLLSMHCGHGLRVMTFNLWLSGREVTDGVQKIANHIKLVDPDIVALEEVEDADVIPSIIKLLGPPWVGVHHCNSTSYPDTGMMTKHEIVQGSYTHVDYAMSVRVQIRETKRQVSFWAAHLDYRSYGPYAAYNKLVDNEDQIMAGEMPTTDIGRVQNMVQLVSSQAFANQMAKSNIIPIIVAGDFNAPSHLDWTAANKEQHGGWVFEWPATKILSDTSGMKDSFREVHPDPIKDPGFTWSTVNKFNKEWDYTIPEPMDRIDFIFYRGPLKPTRSQAYCGNGTLTPIPHQWSNDWPTDHYAVVTDFEDLPESDEPAPPVNPVDARFRPTVDTFLNYQFDPAVCENNYIDPWTQPQPTQQAQPEKETEEGVPTAKDEEREEEDSDEREEKEKKIEEERKKKKEEEEKRKHEEDEKRREDEEEREKNEEERRKNEEHEKEEREKKEEEERKKKEESQSSESSEQSKESEESKEKPVEILRQRRRIHVRARRHE